MTSRRGLCFGGLPAVFLSICVAGPWSLQAAETRLIGQYELNPGVIEPERVTVTLHLRLFNPGTETLEGLELRLGDSLLVGEFLATFPDVTIPRGGTLDIERQVVIPPREHELWLGGGRPKLYLMTTDAEGVPRPQRIELSRERLGNVSAGTSEASGPVNMQNIQQTQPDGSERP